MTIVLKERLLRRSSLRKHLRHRQTESTYGNEKLVQQKNGSTSSIPNEWKKSTFGNETNIQHQRPGRENERT